MSLALIAGSGRLPELLIARAEAPQVFALEDQAPALPVPVQTFRLETFGTLIARMVETGVTELCLAGAIYRPAIDPTRIDPATAPLMPRLAAAIGKGDAGALGVVTDLFEEAGLHIVGAHHLRPDLLPAAGVPTRTQPQDRHGADADRAAGVVAALGAADVGQGCVVAQRQVLAVEALPGHRRDAGRPA